MSDYHIALPSKPRIVSESERSGAVKESVPPLLPTLRRTRFNLLGNEPQTITLSIKGPAAVTAADLKLPGQVEVLNPEQHIAEGTGKAALEIGISAERGLGYIPKESHQKERVDIGTIALDAIFSPIRRVNYEVE